MSQVWFITGGPWNGRKFRQGRSCQRERGHRNWHHEEEAPMTTWTSQALNMIGNSEELQIAPLRRDGTLRKLTTIWVVRVEDDLYVRSVNGRSSDWFRGVQTRHEGRIQAGGVHKDVTFVEVDADDNINDKIDAAYRTKYRRYAESIIRSIVSPEARSATIKLASRSTSS